MNNEGPRGKLVLVIDEDPDARRAARAMLEARGYDVVHASNGLAALELIQRLPSSFQLVLTELDLRGLPGIALVEALRLFRPDLPVLCVTGKRSAAGCLTKPLRPEELDLQLQALLETPGVWDGGPESSSDEAVTRARATYASGGDLVGAALELARGLPQGE